MPSGGLKVSGLLSFIATFAAALLKAPTPNVVVMGTTALALTLVLMVGAYMLLDRLLRHIEKMNGMD
jgi:hypothetical protein